MLVDYINTGFALPSQFSHRYRSNLDEKRNICLVGLRGGGGIQTALGTSFPVRATFSQVLSGGWSQPSYLSHDSYLTWLKGNIPSVCPIEFTVNPVYSKTFWSIYCFLDEPFSLGTIHIGSLYPFQDRMGKVYLQKRTRAIFICF